MNRGLSSFNIYGLNLQTILLYTHIQNTIIRWRSQCYNDIRHVNSKLKRKKLRTVFNNKTAVSAIIMLI